MVVVVIVVAAPAAAVDVADFAVNVVPTLLLCLLQLHCCYYHLLAVAAV